MRKISTILLISLITVTFSNVALAEDKSPPPPSTGTVVADLLLLRPVGVLGTLLGTAACVVSLPVTIPFNSTGQAAEPLILQPYRWTFERPLGKL